MVLNSLNRKKNYAIIFISFIITSLFLSILISPTYKQNNPSQTNVGSSNENNFQKEAFKTSNGEKPLNYSSIYRNTTIIRRGFESIEFKINASGYYEDNGANHTIMQISFTNGTVKNYTMIFEYMHNFSYVYKPGYSAPLGFQIVRFFIYNQTKPSGPMILLNTQATLTNFTIRSTSMVGFNSTEYTRGEYVLADIVIDNSKKFEWDASSVNSTDDSQQEILISFDQNPFQIIFLIDEAYTSINDYYYIKVNMSESGGPPIAEYFGFYINNTNPTVDENTIQFNPTSVFRGEMCNIRINVSDIESNPMDIDVEIKVRNPDRDIVSSRSLYYIGNGIFIGNFTITGSSPKGVYEVEFEAIDENDGKCTVTKKITIKNNLPEIDGYEINDIDTDERISVRYGDDLKFEFDVDDFEGVAYVTVELIMEDESNEVEDEYEVTKEYEDDLEIVIRTEDLVAGTWTVYIYVTDTDGETVDLDDDFDTGPKQISIIPDTLSNYLPWITLISGSILGLIAGLGLSASLRKSKSSKYKPEEEHVKSKKIPKKIQEKKVSIKKKPVAKEIKEEIKREKPEKPAPKRKIKRKL